MSKVLYFDRTTNVILKDNKVIKTKNTITQTEIDAQMLAHKLGLAPEIYSYSLENMIIMEYIEGISLDEYIKTKIQKYSDRQVIKSKVGLAITKMYNAGIRHNDLTGNNILITPNGEIKIIDYEHSVLYEYSVPANLRDHSVLKTF